MQPYHSSSFWQEILGGQVCYLPNREIVYRLKNADKEKNNHYNFSRMNLNFEIGKIVPLGSNPIPLHKRVLIEEKASVKEYISQLDENAVKQVAAQKDELIESPKGKLSGIGSTQTKECTQTLNETLYL